MAGPLDSVQPYVNSIHRAIRSAEASSRFATSGEIAHRGPRHEFAIEIERNGCLWTIDTPLSESGLHWLATVDPLSKTAAGVRLGGEGGYPEEQACIWRTPTSLNPLRLAQPHYPDPGPGRGGCRAHWRRRAGGSTDPRQEWQRSPGGSRSSSPGHDGLQSRPPRTHDYK